MFTVVFLDGNAINLMAEYKTFFLPFIDNGEIAFCNWNPSGMDVKSAIPEIYPLIRGKKNWRAIILDTTTATSQEPIFSTDAINPFDYAVNAHTDDRHLPKVNEVPIVRLCHILAGFPSNRGATFEKAYAYLDNITGEQAVIPAEELTEEQVSCLREQYNESFQSVYKEKRNPDRETACKAIEEQYNFNNIRPTQIYLIATRKFVDADEKKVIQASWETHLEYSSSEFWERNDYPDVCRFLYYNLVNKEHSLYTEQLTKFWLAVVSVATNDIRSSYLQAYRLYRLDVEISESQLESVLNTQMDRINSALNYVNNTLKLSAKTLYEEEENIFPDESIPVSFNAMDGKQLYVPTKNLGLARDCPTPELDFWNGQMRDKDVALRLYLQSPRRAISEAAERTRRRAESYRDIERAELDRFQIEDLEAYAQSVEDEITETDFSGILNEKAYRRALEKKDKAVRRQMRSRMYRSHIVRAGAAALAIYLMGFIPYLIHAYRNSNYVFLKSFGFALLTLLPLALGGIVALVCLRTRLRNVIHEYNDVMREIVAAVHKCAENFSAYFSKLCNYMKVRATLEDISDEDEKIDSERNRMRLHKRALEQNLAHSQEVADAFKITRREQPVFNVTSFFNPSRMPSKNHIYRFPVFTQEHTLQINNIGDFVNRPYAFVDKLIIEREDLFETGKE